MRAILERVAMIAGASALVTVAVTVGGVAPAAADPLPHGDEPRIINPQPTPATVVEAGTVTLQARVAADQPVQDHAIRVDGETVASSRGEGSHPVLSAQVRLEAGRHDVTFEATNEYGSATRRLRLHATAMTTQRLAGRDRVATAAAISQDLYGNGEASAALLARADDFPDSLAGAPAAREVGGPLLLTRGDGLSNTARQELSRVLADGATVYLLGGEGALGDRVATDVEALGFAAKRLAGSGRYETAVRIAETIPETRTAFVASGEGFADALAAAAVAGDRGWPILLTAQDRLPEEVGAYMDRAGFDTVHVVGGAGVIDDSVVAELNRRAGSVSRVAGGTRFETARALSLRFMPETETVGVASGEEFADALAGGVHAAADGAPLALVAGNRLFQPQRRQLRRLQPETAVVYGGRAAVSPGVAEGLRAASVESGELRVERASLRDGQTVQALEGVDFTLNRPINLAESHVAMTIGGNEVGGAIQHVSGADTMRFRVDNLPEGVAYGETHRVVVRLLATSGADVALDRVEADFRRAAPDLSRGAAGPAVTDLQRTLRQRGFWLPSIDGQFGMPTLHAVRAFQKAHGLERDGVVADATRAALAQQRGAPAPRSDSSRAYEVDLERGIVLFVEGGQTRWVFDASAGHGEYYTFEGSTYRANTTTGFDQAMVRQIDGVREAARGDLYRPKYFDGSRGIALHGYTSVPPSHASSGCVRIPIGAMDKVWRIDPGLGTPVHVYPVDYYG